MSGAALSRCVQFQALPPIGQEPCAARSAEVISRAETAYRSAAGGTMDITDGGRVLADAGRRRFLKLSGALTAWGMLGVGTLSSVAAAAALTKSKRDAMTPEDVLAMMKKGNERFRKGLRSDTRSLLAQQQASAKGQYPAAVLLSCIDSRAPAETIMDLGIGDIFNCRVAGNVSNDDILGSMEFACKLAGAKMVLVMGHTACGAIKGAIDQAEQDHLTGMLAKIRPAVEA